MSRLINYTKNSYEKVGLLFFVCSFVLFSLIACTRSLRMDYPLDKSFLCVDSTHPEMIQDYEWPVVTEAALRMGMYLDGPHLCYRANSADEICVSQELFDMLVMIVNHANSCKVFNSLPITKSGPIKFDCVAIALSQWGISYDEIQSFIEAKGWGGGVPETELSTVFMEFFDNDFFYFPASYGDTTMIWNPSVSVGYFSQPDSPTIKHMVNITGFDGENYSVFDYQDSTSYSVPVQRMNFVFYRNSPFVDSTAVNVLINSYRYNYR